jgi:hypothetical protein
MTILKKSSGREQKNRSNTCFIGIYIPKEQASIITLYSLAKGLTKSSIVKDLIVEFTSKLMQEYGEDELIQKVGERAYEAWCDPQKKIKNFHTFVSQLKTEMHYQKGIDEETIHKIITVLHNEKNTKS